MEKIESYNTNVILNLLYLINNKTNDKINLISFYSFVFELKKCFSVGFGDFDFFEDCVFPFSIKLDDCLNELEKLKIIKIELDEISVLKRTHCQSVFTIKEINLIYYYIIKNKLIYSNQKQTMISNEEANQLRFSLIQKELSNYFNPLIEKAAEDTCSFVKFDMSEILNKLYVIPDYIIQFLNKNGYKVEKVEENKHIYIINFYS